MLASLLIDEQKAKFCGIIGYIGKEKKAFEIVSEGIGILENRGYDSIGLGAIKNNQLVINKLASSNVEGDCIEKLLLDDRIKELYSGLNMAIGHTRWATCGGKDDYNAHPHMDMDGQVALVHNGTILNHRELREELERKGIEFTSDTDTEVIAQMIGFELKKEGVSSESAIDSVLERLEGAWGLLIIFKDEPDCIYCTTNGSHMTLGIGEDKVFVASESRAFERYTKQAIEMVDGELVKLGKDETGRFTILNKDIKKYKLPKKERLKKGGFETFFEKEILEQKDAIYNALGKTSRINTIGYTSHLGGLQEAKDAIKGVDSVYFFGCGSSFLSCQYASYFFKLFNVFNHIHVYEASNVEDHDLPKTNSLGIFVSQSGETKDVQRVLKMFKKKGFPTFGIVNVVGSWIAKETDFGCYMNAGQEQSVPSTKSLLCSIVCQILVALHFSSERSGNKFITIRQKICFSLLALNCFIGNLTSKKYKDIAKSLAETLKTNKNLIIISKGINLPIAFEAALKFKEVTYTHAEAIGAGDLKHGPLALLGGSEEEPTKIMLFMMKDDRFEEMALALDEVKARKAYTIVVTDCANQIEKNKIDFLVEIPHIDYLGGILAIIPIQLTCLYLAKLRGINPDKPRNLAKCVTVL